MVDQEETNPLFLASSRRDRNTERGSILSKIDIALADYGKPFPRKGSSFSIAELRFRFFR
jgi:hypothetical protein